MTEKEIYEDYFVSNLNNLLTRFNATLRPVITPGCNSVKIEVLIPGSEPFFVEDVIERNRK